ncbi:MAG TPA: adenosine deaminase [Baekduia sp.]|uniref:adenosine deaminase n=1 Tax=Baekduia sp. TaxID=2600305 RepID=UPI002D77859F|nr:adenosine deaminase [Baekduia sp.]HET6507127.1 adenosine deaminase [Baekduia sp.]
MKPDVAAVPKAELHVHLEGTATPDLIRRLAARNGVALPEERLFNPDGTFRWNDFLHFLQSYDIAASAIRTGADYRDVTYEYLAACAAEGVVYVELIASLDHGKNVGLPDDEHLAGIAQGIDDARRDHGITGRIISSIVRNFGVADCEDVARRTVALDHPYVVGFNMAGDEANFPASDYARAFAIAHEAGLGCSVHAGEHAGPESIRAALELPGVVRISHGVRAVEDPDLVSELAHRQIVLEVCPTSNVVLGVFGSYEEHPLGRLRDAGVPVTLGSDDPPYFGTTIGREYELAHERLGCDLDDLRRITETALNAAFSDTEGVVNRPDRRADL